MLLIEPVAGEKWCPFARTLEGSPPGAAGVNRAGPRADYNCIGSACMAWRWRDPPTKKLSPGVPDLRSADDMQANRLGYCGLAGGADHA